MEYFTAVARIKNITKAAAHLHIAQQTLSAHIAALEQELDCQLLIRHVPLELTYAGQVFLRYALEFQAKYNSLQQEFMDIAGNQSGQLRVSISPVRGRTIMPPIIDSFRKQFPRITIQLSEAANDDLPQKLLNGEADIAIGNLWTSNPEIELRSFYSEEVALLVSDALLTELYQERAEHVIRQVSAGNLAALTGCPFLFNGTDNIAGRIGRHLLQQAQMTPTINVQSVNIETLLFLCLRGVGACFCPKNLIEAALTPEQPTTVQVFRFGEAAHYPIRFGFLKQSYQWSIVSAFMDIASELMKQADK